MLSYETKGSPFERGRQQGAACHGLAHGWMAAALDDLARTVGASSAADAIQQAAPRVDAWRRQMAAVFPAGDETCCGIAAGLGMDEPTYFTAYFTIRMAGVFAQCTTLGFRDADGRPLLGKTDDLGEAQCGNNVLEICRPDEGYRHLHLHYAGTIWTVAGMNERGLAMGMTGIPGPSTENDGMLSLAALHTILPACATVAEAVEQVRTLPLNHYGFSLLLGDADGAMALLEKSAAGTVVLPLRPDGVYLHTNHILDPDFAAQNPAQREPVRTNGQRRFARAERLLPGVARTEAGLAGFLADRGPDGAICQIGADGLTTDFGVLFVPQEKRLTLWPGPPAVTSPESWSMDALFR